MNKSRIVEEFLTLVKIASPTGNERKLADYLKNLLTNLGLTVTEDKTGETFGGNTGNVIAYLSSTKENTPTLLLSAHMDCVSPCENVKPQRKNGIISSDGTTVLGGDDKAGITGIIEAIRTILEKDIPHGGIQIIFTVSEEGGLDGSKYLDKEWIKSDFGFCLDSSGNPGKVIVKAPGQDSITAKIKGKAAHAGLAPEDGINAITIAAIAIAKIRSGRIDAETTANIGMIKGGIATNIVPDCVEVFCEARSCQSEKLAAQTKHMSDVFSQTAIEHKASIDIMIDHAYSSYELDTNSQLIDIATQAITNAKIKPELVATGGGSDANFFNTKGVPCAVLGVGMSKVHTTEEFILEEDLYKTAAIVLELIKTTAAQTK